MNLMSQKWIVLYTGIAVGLALSSCRHKSNTNLSSLLPYLGLPAEKLHDNCSDINLYYQVVLLTEAEYDNIRLDPTHLNKLNLARSFHENLLRDRYTSCDSVLQQLSHDGTTATEAAYLQHLGQLLSLKRNFVDFFDGNGKQILSLQDSSALATYLNATLINKFIPHNQYLSYEQKLLILSNAIAKTKNRQGCERVYALLKQSYLKTIYIELPEQQQLMKNENRKLIKELRKTIAEPKINQFEDIQHNLKLLLAELLDPNSAEFESLTGNLDLTKNNESNRIYQLLNEVIEAYSLEDTSAAIQIKINELEKANISEITDFQSESVFEAIFLFYAQKGDQTRAKEAMDKWKAARINPSFVHWNKFYQLAAEASYVSSNRALHDTAVIHQVLDLFDERNEVMNNIWKTKDQYIHIADIWVYDLEQIVDYMPQTEWTAEIKQRFFDRCYLSKKRQLKKEIKLTDVIENVAMNEYKRLSEDFLSPNFDSPVIQEAIHSFIRTKLSERIIPSVTKSSGLSLDKVIKNLKEDEVIIDLFIGETNLIVQKITNQEYDFITIPLQDVLKHYLDWQSNAINESELSTRLHKSLLTKLEISEYKRVLLSEDGFVHSLPPSLIFPNHEVLLFTDIVKLLDQRKVTLDAHNTLCISYSDHNTLSSFEQKELEELPNSIQECQAMSRYLPRCTTSAGYGTDSSLVDGSYDIVHIASHSFTNKASFKDNYIALRDSVGEIANIYYYDIKELASPPKMVFLSSCKSGNGLPKLGEGVFSVSRGFIEVGSQAVIKSYWDVDDDFAQDFVDHFYRKWSEGTSAFTAFTSTNEYAKNKYDSPKLWATFGYQGNPDLWITH